MNRSLSRSKYEAKLAAAHRQLYYAMSEAEELGDFGAVEDISALLQHITVLTQDSLRGKPRRRRQETLALDNRA